MDYKFDEKKGIFTLYNPETGKDWSNHFFNDLSYITSVTHTGASFSRYVDKNSVQVTFDCPLSAFLYLRDAESKNIGTLRVILRSTKSTTTSANTGSNSREYPPPRIK